MHYYKLNIADWYLATSHLSLEEEAIYFRLINYYYDTEQAIPQETQSVIRRLRLGKNSDLVAIVLKEFFVLEDGFWHHKRCDDEISQYHDKAEVNQVNGKKGGRPKKTQSVSKQNPDITLTTNHKPITKNQYIDKFDLFWDAYGKKRGKPKALAEWKKLDLNDELISKIIDKAKKQAIAIPDPTFRKDPERWLKYQCWEDELISQSVVSKQADDKAWMFSDQGIIDKANELGVSSYGVANYHQLKEKVLFVLAKKAAE
jgi:uncharacterized protein YdaU (DUF1376 family)